MANELNIALAKSGLTVTAQRYQSGAAVGSAISCPEIGSSGFYSGNMTGTAGTYQVAFISASANVGSGSIVWSGTAEVPLSTFNAASDTVANVTLCATTTTLTNAPSVPSASAIASQVRTELATELARVDVATSSRLATSGYTAPSAAPTVTAIRQEMDSNSTKLANLDASVSSRLASSAYSAAPTTAQIATAVESSLLNEADGQAVLNAIVGAIGNTNLSEVSLVAAIRSDIERTGGKLDSVPTAAANATAVWSAATKTITGGTVDTLTNSPSVPSAASIASATRTELAVELARVDAAVSSRMAASEATKLDAVKVKTDALPIERLQNCATTAIVGNLIAQANS